MSAYRRELTVTGVLVALLIVVGATAPGFFERGNLVNLLVDNALVLIAAVGMTAVILTKEIDISIAPVFAVCSYAAGLAAKGGVPPVLLLLLTPLLGALFGALNGALVVVGRIPSMIVTLGTMVAIRGLLSWTTQGAWVLDLPAGFQWLGLGQSGGQAFVVFVALATFALGAYTLANVAAGRALYAVGADQEAARLVGIRPPRVVFFTFVLMGGLMGLAAFLQAIRFQDVQSGAGMGMEMQVIACVVVGGTSINGGRGTLWGTLAGVALLGVISTVLTFEQINPAWARAIQGAIILASVAADAGRGGARHE